jgi:Lrp/AsnC family transcriptional regulator for asnA, asnC and gidA
LRLGKEEYEMTLSIDELDRKIIAILQKDGRTPNVEMARLLGVAEGTIRRRLEHLISEGIIQIAAFTDPHKVGIGMAALINLDVELAHLEEAAQQLVEMPCVRVVAYSTGVHDIFVEALFASQQDLLVFLKDDVPRIPGIRHTDTSIVLQILKRSYQWEIPPVE